jgi:hypothetical protein
MLIVKSMINNNQPKRVQNNQKAAPANAAYRKAGQYLNNPRNRIIAIVAIIVVVGGGVFLSQRHGGNRSVESFCSYYTSSSATDASDSYADRSNFLRELESRAPDEILPQTRELRKAYDKITNNPDSAMSVTTDVMGPLVELGEWTSKHCSDSE